MWSVLTTTATIGLGAFGWFVTRLMFEPIREILDLRRETQECLIIHGNLAKDVPTEAGDRRAASDAFRRIGAGLVSRHIAAYPWVRWWFVWRGYDIHSAGALLIGLGNSTQFEGYSLASLSPNVTRRPMLLEAPHAGNSTNDRGALGNCGRTRFDRRPVLNCQQLSMPWDVIGASHARRAARLW
jgi:hypothetical protein